jgi:hypothetical protein
MSLCVAGFDRDDGGDVMVNSSQSRRRVPATRPGAISGPAREARDLAASIDEAAADLARNGPVSPDDLRRMLADLELEWANEADRRPAPTTRAGRPAR